VLRLQTSRLRPLLILGGLVLAVPSWAVYAPIPEKEQGQGFTYTVKGGVSYDSNLFGAAVNPVGSSIVEFAPRIAYNNSITDQTFFVGAYGLTLDQFDKRPGDKLLDSHDLMLRVAHAFTSSTTIDLVESLMISRNPESLLAGVPLNPDQSFTRNQFDGHFVMPVTAKVGAEVKARSVYYKYRNATLGRSLDRIENLFGLAGNYAILPEVKAVAEYRHQDIFYRKGGEDKNKRSEFLMAGADYEAAKKLTMSARFGAEWRHRSAERASTGPYAEMSGKYDYAQDSFIVAGYGYSYDETSDTARFTDTRTHRLFANIQHHVTPLIVASGSIDYEPAQLMGRRGQSNINEDTIRTGVAGSYLVGKKWTLSLNFDYDRVNSDDPARNLDRKRVGLNADYTF
jgi:hypothetical protein